MNNYFDIIIPQLSKYLQHDGFLKAMTVVFKFLNKEEFTPSIILYVMHYCIPSENISSFKNGQILSLVIILSKLCLPMHSSPENREHSIELAQLFSNQFNIIL